MKIAYLTYELPPDIPKGGIGTYIMQVAKGLHNRKHEIYIFCASPYRDIVECIDGINIFRVKASSPIDFNKKLPEVFCRAFEIYNFDIIESTDIHAHGKLINQIILHVPMIVRLHAPNYLVESFKKRYIGNLAKARFFLGALRRRKWDLGYWRKYEKFSDEEYQFVANSRFITAPSKHMKSWAVKTWNISPEKIQVLPNPFKASQLLLDINIHAKENKTILFFGRLNVLKGIVNATKALKRILEEYPDWQFLIIGDDGPDPSMKGSMKDWVTEKLQEYSSRISFKSGVQYEVLPSVIEQSDIIILPSLFESFSYACAEAMAGGKAVVGSMQGGMADLIHNGYNGFLVDPFQPSDIYKALKKLVQDPLLRKKFGANARASICKLNNDKTWDQFEQFYQTARETFWTK